MVLVGSPQFQYYHSRKHFAKCQIVYRTSRIEKQDSSSRVWKHRQFIAMQVDILEWGRVLGSLEKELQAQLWEGW